MHVRLIKDGEGAVCEAILRDLSEWFGIESYIQGYRQDIDSMETYVLESGDTHEIVGFLTINIHDADTAEIQVMGVRREHHRHGLGRRLVEQAELMLGQRSIKYLTVKTIGPSHSNTAYEATRSFYRSLGFRAVEETTKVWGERAPCLIMKKPL